MSRIVSFAFILGTLLLSRALVSAQDDVPKAVQALFQNTCAQCHGPKGEGNALLQAPPIAALPAWYVRTQLENFRAGRRGFHPQDIAGQMMRSISLVLNSANIPGIATMVASLPRAATPPGSKADPSAGERIYSERCAECHRYNGTGELVFGSAPLAGLPEWYLTAQLRKFKNGQRGAAVGDANGQKMILAATYIEDEATLKSVVAYIMTLREVKAEELFGN
jgi:cytochrome c553